MPEISDLSLIEAAKAGDASAFADVVRSYGPRVHRYLVATGLGQHDADDVVQDTFIRVYRNFSSYNARYAFTTWVFTIAHRIRINLVTRRKVHAPLDGAPEPFTQAESTHETSGTPDGIWSVAKKILNERQFQLLWLRYGEDQELDALASICNISTINARVTLHRARSKLETYLRAEGFAPNPLRGTP